MKAPNSSLASRRGFALVVTLTLMILLSLLAIGMLSLSSISLRASSRGDSMAEARANARLALMIAIGELQKEMGPDMRVSSESAILDSTESTEKIDGVAQSRWLGSYDSWGGWLNADYAPPGKSSLKIQDTYGKGRSNMFRRWLLSLPEGTEKDFNAPRNLAGLDPSRLAVMVGAGSLGSRATSDPDQVTKAYLVDVGKRGRHAWWIGAENQRAKATLAKNQRTLAASEWESSQGDTAEVGVGALDGLKFLDTAANLSDRLVSNSTLEAAGAAKVDAQDHFFDVTTYSKGVVTSVRSGQLKKDLSLLFEKPNNNLPTQYKFNTGDSVEPSIRPMSPDLLAKSPKITKRQFASWTDMRHFYRMYRQNSDASTEGTGNSGSLGWIGSKPYTEVQIPILYRDAGNVGKWQGNNSYDRIPILAKITFIYSLVSEYASGTGAATKYNLYLVYTPIYTYWNPYNVELRMPDNILGCLSSTYQVLPMGTQFFLNDVPQAVAPSGLSTGNAHSFLRSSSGPQIIFKPGEIKVFSHKAISPQSGGQADPLSLVPGFDPSSYGGDKLKIGSTYLASQKPGLRVQFSYSEWGGNINYGNTAGSLCHTPFWLLDSSRRLYAFNYNFPVMYQNDWLNLAQTYTPLNAPGNAGIAHWVFTDNKPTPVAYAQLVIKGASNFNYESIDWEKDWRVRNWIQSPPSYFGGQLYMSEDTKTAHTQRLDCPYIMNFGPMSQAELPKVVFQVGENGFLGSGSNPMEKITAAPTLELPTAPIANLAGFSGMRINPGWADPVAMNSDLSVESIGGNNTSKGSYAYALEKTIAYQSGVTGPGIGNSFMHPMLPRTGVYGYFNNSVSADPADRRYPLDNINFNDNKIFCDYWDHVFLLNDALWDDYFVSSLADQTGPRASAASSLNDNLDRLVTEQQLPNSRYVRNSTGQASAVVKTELQAADGYLKAAKHLMVDGMFNVNSTSVDAWYALFAGIRERKAVFRESRGALKEITVPPSKRIVLTRFNTEVSDKEMDDPETGETMPGGGPGWTGVRFLGDDELENLARECVKQVKLRGPFLNYSEFVNRRLSNDALGVMGALQSAIDYDDASPESNSINYRYKNGRDYMLKAGDLGTNSFATPEAAVGSRFAGIPGYVIQSDLLKPIANTLSVRDDTFRIRAYGESLDSKGNVIARAWCEAIVQRLPEYYDPTNPDETPLREIGSNGAFVDSGKLSKDNIRFGRRFKVESFRWLSEKEV